MTESAEQRLRRYRRTMEGLLGVPATEGNVVDVLHNGDEIFPSMLAAIREATSTIDFATYVYWTGDIADEFANSLSERAQAGVRVRILLDAVGAQPMNRELIGRMEGAGCLIEFFREPTTWKVWETNHRTHRKLLICDEAVAFTGGVGIAEEWCGDARHPGEWRDTHVRLRGPAVDGLRAAFVSNWAETGHELYGDADRFPEQPQDGGVVVQVVQCPAQIGWSDMATTVAALIMLAEERLRVTSAYFVPDDRFRELLCAASRRGVEVEVLLPGEHADKRIVQIAGEESYEMLLEDGVRVHRYQPSMMHAKIVTVDGLVTTVGSANFDQRSLGINEEVNIVAFDQATTQIFDHHFDQDQARSKPVQLGQWRRRGPVQRIKETVSDAFDEQL
ncbi:MAG: cardiolipin synthase B [Euzebyales bacterium]|nr:cardiolipin synthase B [Euzebyales bacterium]